MTKHSAVANANLEMMNSEPPVTSGFHEELDDIIIGKLGEEPGDIVFDRFKDHEIAVEASHEQQTSRDPDTRELPTIIAPEPSRGDFVLDHQNPRRAFTPNRLPPINTDMTSTTLDTYQISTPGDSAIVLVTPCTTQDNYEKTGVEEHDGCPGTSTIGCNTPSMGMRSSISMRVSGDTRRTSLSNDIPSREPAPVSVPTKEPSGKEFSIGTPNHEGLVSQNGETKRGIRARCRKKAAKMLQPIWIKFKERVEDVLST